ncbi:MAG: hypothetical protein CMA77_01040 [Euryarchaeota archaeon]|nr:hypothetical protein [Euryarchaeota archaeon]
MFEDFENRSGFWKDLGSNFTINYSGDAPSFLTSGEMWQSMDSGTTQTLAAWEDGWVLTNNPDGTITANPKYTSGLPSETLVKVPVGPQSPKSSPTSGVGGVALDSSAVFQAKGVKSDEFTGDKVIIFQHCLEDENFSDGWKMSLGAGEYDRETLTSGSKNDQISAIYVPEGYTVVAHQNYIDDAETGETWEWVGPTSKTCLADGSGAANDEISYLKITYEDPEPDADPNDCASENRAVKSDKTCGACLTGYSLVGGKCIADEEEEETDWAMWGMAGLAIVAVLFGMG